MDSSSEGSFAWTDASSESSDNETMAKMNNSIHQSGEESESGKTYKKKLHQKLFSDEAGSEQTQAHQHRKRKLSGLSSDEDNTQRSKKKRVKQEPESEAETPTKKKKKSLETRNRTESASDLYDESFLNSKVKSEQNFAIPTPGKVKKKKKKNDVDANDTILSNGHADPTNDSTEYSNSHKNSEDSSATHSTLPKQDTEHKPKVKKNKRSSESYASEVDQTENNIETIQDKETTIKERHTSVSSEENTLDLPPTPEHVNRTPKTSEKEIKSNCKDASISEKKNLSQSRRKSRMSERIQFEDEEDSDVQANVGSVATDTKKSKKVARYMKSSEHLRPLPAPGAELADDDVWLLRCPAGLRPQAFLGKSWSLGERCKLKLDGLAFEAEPADAGAGLAVLGAGGRARLARLALRGALRLRRRLPKPPAPDAAPAPAPARVPLPDTKCRHPLLGLHYKKAIKLPRAVAARLRRAPPPSPPREHEHEDVEPSRLSSKKKKKRKRSESAEEHAAPAPAPAPAPEADEAPRHKKKKRRLGSAELWDSEKAIEENLFNF